MQEVEPISNCKEGKEELRQLVRAGKRRKSIVPENEGDLNNSGDDDRSLIMQSQIRESGRARERPKGLEAGVSR